MVDIEQRLAAIGIEAGTITNILKNKAVTAKFTEVLNLSGLSACPKEKGALLYAVATKVKPVQQPYLAHFVEMVVQDKWTRVNQLDEAIKWLDDRIKANGKEYKIEQAEWEAASGVGVVVTEEQIAAAVDKLFDEHALQIKELGHDFQFNIFLNKMKDHYKWADGGLVRNVIQKKKIELLGEE